jgi:hypothetical protein
MLVRPSYGQTAIRFFEALDLGQGGCLDCGELHFLHFCPSCARPLALQDAKIVTSIVFAQTRHALPDALSLPGYRPVQWAYAQLLGEPRVDELVLLKSLEPGTLSLNKALIRPLPW